MGEQRANGLSIAAALAASVIWGLQALYWKSLIDVPPSEILAHRVIWSFVFMTLFALVMGRGRVVLGEAAALFKDRPRLVWVVLGAFMVGLNWLANIWAINNDRVVEASLGSYMVPLGNVVVGLTVFRERLSLWQFVAVILAAAGIAHMAVKFGSLPWISLAVAATFTFYGFCKKISRLSAVSGMVIDTSLIAPAALIYLAWLRLEGLGHHLDLSPTSFLLMGAGLFNIVPLLLYAFSVNNLSLTLSGLLQYLAPTISFFLGVFVYDEPFTRTHLITFGFIWAALLIFSLARTRPMVYLERLVLTLLFRR